MLNNRTWPNAVSGQQFSFSDGFQAFSINFTCFTVLVNSAVNVTKS